MEPNLIAVEPIHGWSGPQVMHSKTALNWLYYEAWKLEGNRIHHFRNGGEQVIILKQGRVFVDGYDAKTKTVYECQGCEFHGCKKCKPNGRHVKTFHHPDRTVEEMYEATKMKIKKIREAGYKVVEK